MKIQKYTPADAEELFALIEREGDEWEYWQGDNPAKYKALLSQSITYLAFDGETLCGYILAHDNGGFGIYIYDLLVDRAHRGKQYGKYLINRLCQDHPAANIYVMSDVDEYYQKQGFKKAGSIFMVAKSNY